MSLADIILTTSQRAYEARSRGIQNLATGITSGITSGLAEKRRREELEYERKKEEEEREYKYRFLTAQAGQMEATKKAAEHRMSQQSTMDIIIQKGANKGWTPDQIKLEAEKEGVGVLAQQWYDDKIISDKRMLAAEVEQWKSASSQADYIGLAAMGPQSEQEWVSAIQRLNQEVSELKGRPVNILQGIEDLSWEDQQKQLMASSQKVQDLMYKKQKGAYNHSLGTLFNLKKRAIELEEKGDKRTPEEDRELKLANEQIGLENQKTEALIDAREQMNLARVMKQKGVYAEKGREIIQGLFSKEEGEEISDDRAMMAEESAAMDYAASLLERGVSENAVREWAARSVRKVDHPDWGFGFGRDMISFTPMSDDEVKAAGGSPSRPPLTEHQIKKAAQNAVDAGEYKTVEEAERALRLDLGY
jgi:hypothetical protein